MTNIEIGGLNFEIDLDEAIRRGVARKVIHPVTDIREGDVVGRKGMPIAVVVLDPYTNTYRLLRTNSIKMWSEADMMEDQLISFINLHSWTVIGNIEEGYGKLFKNY